jgi:hypothetical protein
LKWTLAKRTLIDKKYGHNNTVSVRAALPSDLPHADTFPHVPLDVPTLEECTDVYDDIEVGLSFNSVAFSSSLTLGRDRSNFWVVDSACSIDLTECRDNFVTFEPPSGSTRIGGVGENVKGSGTIRLAVPLVSDEMSTEISTRCLHPTSLRGPLSALDAF